MNFGQKEPEDSVLRIASLLLFTTSIIVFGMLAVLVLTLLFVT